MRILVHALGATTGGGMRHLTNFLREIGKADGYRQYTIWVRSSFPMTGELNSNVQLERIAENVCQSWIQRLIYDLWLLPAKLKREKYDAVVSLTGSGPIWSPVPLIHFQRNAIYYCPYYLKRISGLKRLETILRRCHAVAAMSRATVTVTPSDAMAHMIRIACPHIRHRRMVTLYHGFDYVSYDDALDPEIQTKVDRIQRPRLLYATHIAQYKGFDVLFEALVALQNRSNPVGLVIAGLPAEWPIGGAMLLEKIKILGLHDTVVFLGGVPQRQMGSLYRSCDLVVNPSLCESFAFSMIEALGHQLPVVAADLPINREICGAAALYYPALDARRAATVIAEALQDRERAGRERAAREQLRRFDWSWRRYAKEFASLIDSVVGVSRGGIASE